MTDLKLGIHIHVEKNKPIQCLLEIQVWLSVLNFYLLTLLTTQTFRQMCYIGNSPFKKEDTESV